MDIQRKGIVFLVGSVTKSLLIGIIWILFLVLMLTRVDIEIEDMGYLR